MRKTVGMEAEQCSESIHPIVNELQRKYNTVRNSKNRLELTAKSQWLKSNRSLKNYRNPSEFKIG